MNKKNIAIYSTLALLIVGGLYLVKPVSADEDKGHGPLIQRLIERFNLNEDEVDGVVSEYREERHQERQADISAKLQTAVDEGKITSEQKEAILTKMAEHQGEEPGEGWENREERRADMQAWQEENGIDLHDLMIGFGMGPKGEGRGMQDGQRRNFESNN